MDEARTRRHEKLEPEVKAARAIKRALDGLTLEEREKALHLSIGRREAAARLARYRMGVEAIQLALPPSYTDLKALVDLVLRDPS
jgi:hypothetical protein